MPKLNLSLELHDSKVSEISRRGNTVVIKFKDAYVHRSGGEPGVAEGTGWSQATDIAFSHANIIEIPTGGTTNRDRVISWLRQS